MVYVFGSCLRMLADIIVSDFFLLLWTVLHSIPLPNTIYKRSIVWAYFCRTEVQMVTKTISDKLISVHERCLQKILGIFCPIYNSISNKKLMAGVMSTCVCASGSTKTMIFIFLCTICQVDCMGVEVVHEANLILEVSMVVRAWPKSHRSLHHRA